jgi:hypothetical protein
MPRFSARMSSTVYTVLNREKDDYTSCRDASPRVCFFSYLAGSTYSFSDKTNTICGCMLSLLFISCRKDYISLLDWKTEMRSEFLTSILFYPLAAAWIQRLRCRCEVHVVTEFLCSFYLETSIPRVVASIFL